MGATIKVGMADLNVCKAPDAITTLGLGSCIGIAVYGNKNRRTRTYHAARQHEDKE